MSCQSQSWCHYHQTQIQKNQIQKNQIQKSQIQKSQILKSQTQKSRSLTQIRIQSQSWRMKWHQGKSQSRFQ